MEGIAVYRDMHVWVPDITAAIAFAEAQYAQPRRRSRKNVIGLAPSAFR
jgi:hypothetical protein